MLLSDLLSGFMCFFYSTRGGDRLVSRVAVLPFDYRCSVIPCHVSFLCRGYLSVIAEATTSVAAGTARWARSFAVRANDPGGLLLFGPAWFVLCRDICSERSSVVSSNFCKNSSVGVMNCSMRACWSGIMLMSAGKLVGVTISRTSTGSEHRTLLVRNISGVVIKAVVVYCNVMPNFLTISGDTAVRGSFLFEELHSKSLLRLGKAGLESCTLDRFHDLGVLRFDGVWLFDAVFGDCSLFSGVFDDAAFDLRLHDPPALTAFSTGALAVALSMHCRFWVNEQVLVLDYVGVHSNEYGALVITFYGLAQSDDEITLSTLTTTSQEDLDVGNRLYILLIAVDELVAVWVEVATKVGYSCMWHVEGLTWCVEGLSKRQMKIKLLPELLK
ncbi:hypothetical protein KCU65_g67, partial [Aureobasidium melanogenum]